MTTVEDIFPTASISQPAVDMLTRYVSLFLSFWPLIIGVAVVFCIVYFLLRSARQALTGNVVDKTLLEEYAKRKYNMKL